MKRFIVILFILILCLCSCGREVDILGYQNYPMTVTGTLTQGDFSCAVTVNISQKGVAELTVDSPETLKGYSFKVDNGSIWVYYDNMEIDLHALQEDIPMMWVSEMLSVDCEEHKYSRSEDNTRLDFFVGDTAETVVYTLEGEEAPYRIEYSRQGQTLRFDIDTLIVQ